MEQKSNGSRFIKSHKLDNVCYDIRGEVLDKAIQMERNGIKILRLNTGNPGAFGFDAPDELLCDLVGNIHNAVGYSDSQGIFPARKAIQQYYQTRGVFNVGIDDIFIGNGVSELIQLSMQALLNEGDEILIPAPDYPLWTAAVVLNGGKAVHYRCDETSDWYPDPDDIRKKITPRTKGIVVINPNNPTGAVYPAEILTKIVRLAEEHNLILFADEIYEKILYDGAVHIPAATLSSSILTVTFNGLSKAYRAAGFRVGWMVLSGNREQAADYIEGLKIVSNMRLCSNVPGQFAVQAALGGYQSIDDLTKEGGRLKVQRDICYRAVTSIPGLSCVNARGALYLFPKVDTKKFGITDDKRLIYDILVETNILFVQGTGFNHPEPDHFRIVFLPDQFELEASLGRLEQFFANYRQN